MEHFPRVFSARQLNEKNFVVFPEHRDGVAPKSPRTLLGGLEDRNH